MAAAAKSSLAAAFWWIAVVAAVTAVFLVPSGEAVKYGMCQSECLNIQPNCDAWCKRIGYPDGGECVEPRNIDCCCWEIPPAAGGDDDHRRRNGTAVAGSLQHYAMLP